MQVRTVGDLKKYLEEYKGADTDKVFALITGIPGRADDELAKFIATDFQAHMGKMQMGFFACDTLPMTMEGAEELQKSAFFFTTI